MISVMGRPQSQWLRIIKDVNRLEDVYVSETIFDNIIKNELYDVLLWYEKRWQANIWIKQLKLRSPNVLPKYYKYLNAEKLISKLNEAGYEIVKKG